MRLLTVGYQAAQKALTPYLNAIESGNAELLQTASSQLVGLLDGAIEQALQIPVAGADECVAALERLRTAATKGLVPSTSDLDAVTNFVTQVYQ